MREKDTGIDRQSTVSHPERKIDFLKRKCEQKNCIQLKT